MTAKFPSPGEVFEDTYLIEAILGSGGFARVYRATEVGLQRQVALKILRPPVSTSQSDSQRDSYLETLMERFQREAMMLSKLRSSYTVNLYKYGKTPGGLLYMALEYIDGLSLAEILRAGKPLEASRVRKILKQVLSSLQEAHLLGMLHRDLKPANIMVYEHLGERDQVKLLDFGIAKLVTEQAGEHQKDLTSDGTLIGTPRYMAPEQIQGTDIGPPADIYALGLVAYELLTGERAIKGDSSIQIIGKQLAPQSFRLPEGDEIPEGLRRIVNKMIEKEIPNRYRQADEIIQELNSPGLLLADDIPEISSEDITRLDDAIETIEDIPIVDEHSHDAVESFHLHDDTKDQPLPQPKRRPLALLLGAGLLIALLAIIGFVAMTSTEHEGPIASPEPVKPVPEPSPEPTPTDKVPEVKVTARYDGRDVEGATILVDGVEKGVTPLTLQAMEVSNAKVVARFQAPNADEELEETQEVTDPRDVLFEFDAALGELIPPSTVEKPEKPAPKTEAKSKPEPKATPRPRPRPRPEPKPKPEVDPYSIIPE